MHPSVTTFEPGPLRQICGIFGRNLLLLAVVLWQGWGVLLLLWPVWIESALLGAHALKRLGGRDALGRPFPRAIALRTLRMVFGFGWGLFHFMMLAWLLIATLAAVAPADALGEARLAIRGLDLLDGLLLLGFAALSWQQQARETRQQGPLRGLREAVILLLPMLLRLVPVWLFVGAAVHYGDHAVVVFVVFKLLTELAVLPMTGVLGLLLDHRRSTASRR